ncbi:MATE family efflux transporter [Roseimarinus sediminis]|uniref:MATE family efflux transporter n=1 Tax=Roseimarinus sediminis TaxID=1610899 RepID=UPI003D252B83
MNILHQIKPIYKEIIEALRGTEHDYTSGNIKRAVFLLSVPMVLEMLMESVFAIVDIFFVSKLGAEAIATVGITESVITIIYALAVGLSAAASAMISRRVGEKAYRKAAISAWQAILTVVFISVLLAIPGVFFTQSILGLMNASETIIHEYSSYTAIIFGSNVVILLLFINNAIFRSAGNAVLSMRVLWMANLLNIVLDPLLIFGWGPIPAMGIKGAAIATTIGRGLAVVYQFYLLWNGKGRIKIKGISYRPDFTLIKQLLKLSTGSVSQYIVATSSWIILMRFVAVYGSEVLAGYTVALRLIMVALLPAWGIANAASTLVGQNLGALNPERARQAAWIAGKANMMIMGLVSILLCFFPNLFLGWLTTDVVVIDHGTISLRIISYGLIIYGLGMVLVNAINGAGDTQTPFRINLVAFWIIEIPLAWLLSSLAGWNQAGVFWAIFISETLMTFMVLFFFIRGKWQQKTV